MTVSWLLYWACTWLRRLAVRLPPRRPVFDSGSVHVIFVVDRVVLWQVFRWVLRVSAVISFHQCPILNLDFNTTYGRSLGTFKLELFRQILWRISQRSTCKFRSLRGIIFGLWQRRFYWFITSAVTILVNISREDIHGLIPVPRDTRGSSEQPLREMAPHEQRR